MPKGAKISKFGRKYGFFLSNASNEEILSVSKELTDGLSEQIRLVTKGAVALLAVALLSLILSISMISGLSESVTGSVKSTVFLLRIIAVALICVSGLEAYLSVSKAMSAGYAAPLTWRHVRETASDENTYEQTAAVREISQLALSSKNLLDMSAFVLSLSGVLIGISYILQMMAESGYV